MTGARGITLLELVVSIALLGLIAGIAGLSWRPGREAYPTPWLTTVAAARRQALSAGVAVVAIDTSSDTLRMVQALPDGRTILDSVLPDAR